MEVIPGILEKDWTEIERKVNLVKSFARTIHIDIIDGKFAPNTTFIDPLPFKKFTSPSAGSELFFELHMMVENPIQYLKPWASAGFKRFLGHVEKMPDQEKFVAQGKLLGEVGLAVDGPTPLETIKVPYEDLDCVLIMAIPAGESGQTFNPEYLKKIEILKPASQRGEQVQHDMKIEVDGGINDQTIIEAKNAGATRFIANSFIFNPTAGSGQNPQEQYNLLQERIHKW